MNIHLTQIRLPEKDLRASINAEALDELADSLRDRGQLQAIGVRAVDLDLYEVVFGARRFRAATMLNWETIRAEVIPDADDQTTASNKLIENIQREDLTPIEEAYGVLELIGDDEPNFRRLQQQTGKSREWIRTRLELAIMPEDLQKALQSNSISIGVARAFSIIESDKVRDQFTQYAAENGLTADDARRWAMNATAAETGIQTMLEHNEQLELDRQRMPPILQKWNCFSCREPRLQTECSMLVICGQCQHKLTRGRTPGE